MIINFYLGCITTIILPHLHDFSVVSLKLEINETVLESYTCLVMDGHMHVHTRTFNSSGDAIRSGEGVKTLATPSLHVYELICQSRVN